MSRRSLKRKQGGFILAVTMAVLALFAVLFVQGRECLEKQKELKAKVNNLQQVYERDLEENEELKDKKEYMGSLEYIEDTAREKLGLVYEDEVIFREKNDDSE